MQCGIVGLCVVLTAAASVCAAEPAYSRSSGLRSCWPSNRSVIGRRSSLLDSLHRDFDQRSRPTFGLRLVVDSSDHTIRLVDEEAGTATISSDDGFAPDASADPEVITETAPDELLVPPEPLSNEPVPIDGAAEKAERETKKGETKPATSDFSLGWVFGDQDKLGILELQSRSLQIEIGEGETNEFNFDFGYAIRWLTGPKTTDLPPQLYTLLMDVAWAHKVDDHWTLDALITPTWNTDFENKRTESFRLPWHGVAHYRVDSDWSWVMGIADLDRRDIRLLPVIGVTYAPPDGTVQFDLIFPRPRLAWRLDHDEDRQHWLYVAGELGGGSWAIRRADRTRDMVTLRDLRLLVGLETRRKKRHAGRLEGGWVFDRVIDYRSGVGNYHPSDTAIIRWSSDF